MRVWADCTAAAHPLVLRPIVERLREQGHEVEITTREYGQTVGILERLGLEHTVVGRHGGGSMVRKGSALAGRSAQLTRWARPKRFDLSVAHGSVDLAVVSTTLRIPSAQMQDYEHAGLQRKLAWKAARRVLVPDAIPVEAMVEAGAAEEKLVRYPGLKEDYYLADFEPSPRVLSDLGLPELGISSDRMDDRVLVVVRPPPETSEYHAQNDLYEGVLDRLAAAEAAIAVLIPRTDEQRAEAEARADPSLVVPARGDRRAEPDRLRGPGRLGRRDDEPRGGRAWDARAHDLHGRARRRRREAHGRGAPVAARRPGRPRALASATTPAGVQNPRDAALLVDGILGAVEA